MKRQVVLLTLFEGEALASIVACFRNVGAAATVVRTLEELETRGFDATATLVSFGTGVILPAALLRAMPRPAYNLHAASPDFPGRDPHHHAAFAGVCRYGATLHVMHERVDAGPIVAVELVDVASGSRPRQLLDLANAAGIRLLRRHANELIADQPMSPIAGVAWGPIKTSRADLIAASRIKPDIGLDEFEQRFHAFDGEAHDNLTVEVHGWTFRIDKAQGRKF